MNAFYTVFWSQKHASKENLIDWLPRGGWGGRAEGPALGESPGRGAQYGVSFEFL
jgi:hypothetical protein